MEIVADNLILSPSAKPFWISTWNRPRCQNSRARRLEGASKMFKRSRGDVDHHEEAHSHPKRMRLRNHDRFSNLSDELILRTLSYLQLSDRITCLRCVSPRHHRPELIKKTFSPLAIFSRRPSALESCLLLPLCAPPSLSYTWTARP